MADEYIWYVVSSKARTRHPRLRDVPSIRSSLLLCLRLGPEGPIMDPRLIFVSSLRIDARSTGSPRATACSVGWARPYRGTGGLVPQQSYTANEGS